jgi:transposase
MRFERESVCVVLPAGSCLVTNDKEGSTDMAIIGMDIHRAFAEAIAVEGKTRRRLGRIDLRRDRLEAFATGLKKDDIIVVEATGNAAAVAEVLAPHVGRVVIANPKQVHLIARSTKPSGARQ